MYRQRNSHACVCVSFYTFELMWKNSNFETMHFPTKSTPMTTKNFLIIPSQIQWLQHLVIIKIAAAKGGYSVFVGGCVLLPM